MYNELLLLNKFALLGFVSALPLHICLMILCNICWVFGLYLQILSIGKISAI